LRTAHERARHPEWTDHQVETYVKRVFLRAAT